MLMGLAAAAAGKFGLGALTGCAPPIMSLAEDGLEPEAYLPLVSNAPTPTPTPTNRAASTPTATHTPTPQTSLPPPTDSRVVHVHSASATFWNGETDYWNYVDQDVVDTMVDQGMKALTGAPTAADAWETLLPSYKNGQGIAIKVNFNNTPSCSNADGQIDALIHPINAVVRGLIQTGVTQADIWIYDAIRSIPDRFVDGSQYGGIRYFDKVCRDRAKFESRDPDSYVAFSAPSAIPTPPTTKITDVLIEATYLINIPIMKTHGYTGVTLGFKNHFGTIDKPDPLHDYVGLNWPYYRSDYSLFVDLYRNPHVGGKTVLTIGDGLFAAKNGTTSPPSPWTTFGDRVPNSLFFATDPVAVDCVMSDFLAAETSVPTASDDYLSLASDAGLGVFERGDPWESGYSQIEYLRFEL
jgi:hypothetical protein